MRIYRKCALHPRDTRPSLRFLFQIKKEQTESKKDGSVDIDMMY